jgi:CRISPR-associated DxTHG motif protein
VKVLSFLGTGNYSEVEYNLRDEHGDKRLRTRFSPVANCTFFEADRLVVLATVGARETHLQALKDELARHTDAELTHVDIPDGRSEVELWSIFDALEMHVGRHERVVLDVTHGYRSLPVLGLIAADYLKAVRDVDLRAVVYGAYEARDGDRCPIFDLTPFLSLLEWTAATTLFRQTGNAEPLAGLLRQIQDTLHRTGGGQTGLPTRLKPAADALGRVSEAMRLIRVHEAMQAAHELIVRLERARADTAAWARPFAALIDEMRDAYWPFALEVPAADPLRDLEVQLDMIRWYAEKGWGAEAVALAREWVVSLEVLRSGFDLMGKREREAVERALGDALAPKRQPAEQAGGDEPVALPPAARDPLPASVDVWSQLADLRNDIAHAGMRPGPRPARSISGSIAGLHHRLTPLFEVVRAQVSGGG